MKKFIIYNRVSSESQREGTSLERQEEQNRALVAQNGGDVVAVFNEVMSGNLYFSRSKFQEAITLIEKGEADGLALLDLERFARHAAFQEIAIERITRAGGTVIFCRDEFNDTPEGRLYRGVRGHVTQYYREKQRILSMDGMAAIAHRGQIPNGNSKPPYGYRIISKAEVAAGNHPGPAGLYEIVPEQAQWVEKIFLWRVEELSLEQIGDLLTLQGAPTLYGGKWLSGTVLHLLRNSVHKGQAFYGKTSLLTDETRLAQGKNATYRKKNPREQWISIPCPAIISPELWEAAQKVRVQPQRKRKAKTKLDKYLKRFKTIQIEERGEDRIVLCPTLQIASKILTFAGEAGSVTMTEKSHPDAHKFPYTTTIEPFFGGDDLS